MAMIEFRIVARIGQSRLQPHLLQRRVQKWHKAIDIHPWAAAEYDRQRQMAGAFKGDFELRVAAVRDGLPTFGGAVPALNASE
jgi:hypothetical protein